MILFSRAAVSVAIASMVISVFSFASSAGAGESTEVRVEEGMYLPFFREKGEEPTKIGPLIIDRNPVSNSDFLKFVKNTPKWRRSRIPEVFTASGYLAHWKGDLEIDPTDAQRPVTNVSWFAARAYCSSKGKRLLNVNEWEFASDAQNPVHLEQILNWYGEPNRRPKPIAEGFTNKHGLRGMHGLIWEWVEDYSSVIIAGDSRDSNDTKGAKFCGAGAMNSRDPSEYATFMRYAHRSSLKGNYVGGSLGFRCARSEKP